MKNGLIIGFLVLFMGCQQSEPNYAHIILEEQGDRYVPQLDILVQSNALSIQIKLDGTAVYDTSYILSPQQASKLYHGLKENGVKIYNQETPEWKTRNTTIFKDSQLLKATQLARILNAFDGQYQTTYRTFVEAADEASEENDFTDAQIFNEAELLDSLKAD